MKLLCGVCDGSGEREREAERELGADWTETWMERESRRETWLAGCVGQEGGGILPVERLGVLRGLPSTVVRGRLDGLRSDAGLEDDTEATVQ